MFRFAGLDISAIPFLSRYLEGAHHLRGAAASCESTDSIYHGTVHTLDNVELTRKVRSRKLCLSRDSFVLGRVPRRSFPPSTSPPFGADCLTAVSQSVSRCARLLVPSEMILSRFAFVFSAASLARSRRHTSLESNAPFLNNNITRARFPRYTPTSPDHEGGWQPSLPSRVSRRGMFFPGRGTKIHSDAVHLRRVSVNLVAFFFFSADWLMRELAVSIYAVKMVSSRVERESESRIRDIRSSRDGHLKAIHERTHTNTANEQRNRKSRNTIAVRSLYRPLTRK